MAWRSRAATASTCAADLDLGVAAGELQRGLDAAALGALEVGLGGEEVGRGDAALGDRASRPASRAAATASRGLLRAAPRPRARMRSSLRQFLTGALFSAFTEGPDPLEPEREGGCLHVGSIGRWGLDLK